MISRIFRKDWILLWPLAVLLTAIQAGFDWAFFRSGLVVGNPLAGELSRILGVAWIVGALALTVAVVQEDPIPGAEQDWLARPLRRTDLLLAKLSFVLVMTILPVVVINLLHELARGFPWMPSLAYAIYKGMFVFLCLSIPAMALAAMTRNMTETLIGAAGLVVLYAACLWLSAGLFGAGRCPTCDSGIEWLQHLLQHVELLAGAAVILTLQYFRRRTTAARRLALAGIVALVFVQLPWDTAFRLQSRLSNSAAAASRAVAVASGSGSIAAPAPANQPASSRNLARQATRELMQGELGAAVGDLQRFSSPDEAPVVLSFPLRITGVAPGEFLIVDRIAYSLADAHGRVVYRGVRPPQDMILRASADSGAPSGTEQQQELAIARSDFERVRAVAARLDVTYWLTLVRLTGQYRMRAGDGLLRAAQIGLCETKPDPDQVRLRCEQIGRAPFCYSATLFGAHGEHNPEKLQCSADYRPYIPSVSNIFSSSGVNIPIRDPFNLAHYPVAIAELPDASVLLKIFGVQAHFERAVSVQLRASQSSEEPQHQ